MHLKTLASFDKVVSRPKGSAPTFFLFFLQKFQKVCYIIEEKNELLLSINNFLDETVVLPPGVNLIKRFFYSAMLKLQNKLECFFQTCSAMDKHSSSFICDDVKSFVTFVSGVNFIQLFFFLTDEGATRVFLTYKLCQRQTLKLIHLWRCKKFYNICFWYQSYLKISS